MPSTSVLPDGANRSIRIVLTDLDLSMIVSVPMSMRPIERGSMLYLRSNEEVTEGQTKLQECTHRSGGSC